MPQVSQKTLIMLIVILCIALLFTLLYGCSCTYEKFENGETEEKEAGGSKDMKKKTTEVPSEEGEEVSTNGPAPSPSPAPSPARGPATAAAPSLSPAPTKAPTEELNSQEKELFEQITTNKLSGEELEKLIKAGVVTEQMIEKFLSQLDSSSEEKNAAEVEGFCAGDCYAKY